MLNPWTTFPFHAAWLGWEAQKVTLLLLGFPGGKADAKRESNPIVTKIDSLADASMAAVSAPVKKQTALTNAAIKDAPIKGANGRRAATKITRVYKKRSRIKKRRLSK